MYQVVGSYNCRWWKTQVEGAQIGMAQNIGGSGSTVITHILQAE
jgi:hypothetical protein